MRPDYDLRGGRRGRHAAAYAEGTNLVRIDPDVMRRLSATDINRVLREYLDSSAKQLASENLKPVPARDVAIIQRSESGHWQVIGLPEAFGHPRTAKISIIDASMKPINELKNRPESLIHMWLSLFPQDDSVEILELPAPFGSSPFEQFWRKK